MGDIDRGRGSFTRAQMEFVAARLSAELTAFVRAVVGLDEEATGEARAALVTAAGPELLVEAAAVLANFEMMTRVADGTGARFD